MIQSGNMKISSVLIVLKHFQFGGTERYAINLAHALSKKGVSVFIAAEEGPYAQYISPKINVFYVPGEGTEKERNISEKIIAGIVAKYKPQIIHAQCRNSLLRCQLARRKFQIPIIGHEHIRVYKDNDYPFVTIQLRRYTDKVITILPNIAKKLILHGLQENHVTTIPTGINITEFPPIMKNERTVARRFFNLNAEHKVVLCLSRIVPGKDIKKLVDAFKLVVGKVPNAKLLIAGDDEWNQTKPKIEQSIREDKLEKHIFLYPAHFDIRKFHCAADVFCYPPVSRGMAVMEAMASGLPVVARKLPKKTSVVEDNISGLLLYTDSRKELAEKLILLLRDKPLARKMGKNARKRIEEQFDLETTVLRTLSTYEEVINSYPLRSEMRLVQYEDE